jgi:hypothetical protein
MKSSLRKLTIDFGCGERVDLRSVDPIRYLNEFADLLRIHGSLCQVLRASGAGKVIDKRLVSENRVVRWLRTEERQACWLLDYR